MKKCDVILTPLVQSDGAIKNRPALVLAEMPGFGDMLVCGISTQVHQCVPQFDEIISRNDSDFSMSGLIADSVIRLGFLAVLPQKHILGKIGSIAFERHARLIHNLTKHLTQSSKRI